MQRPVGSTLTKTRQECYHGHRLTHHRLRRRVEAGLQQARDPPAKLSLGRLRRAELRAELLRLLHVHAAVDIGGMAGHVLDDRVVALPPHLAVAACLLLAAKSCEEPRRIRDVLNSVLFVVHGRLVLRDVHESVGPHNM